MFDEERPKLPTFVYLETPPPEGDLNSHTPWSAWDEQDVRYAVEQGELLAETAITLCRTVKRCEKAKAKKMGLEFKR